LNERRDLVPTGVPGEIYIGGTSVARGYLNRPELTAERFIPSPFVESDRLYKTGDLARYLPDGTIEFLGRNDQQVKIRGFRIELGEIESRLNAHEGVRDAVVAAREDVPGDKRLVAYYRPVNGAVSAESLRTHLQSSLPEYMVPAAYVELASLPLTPNGKLDRKALPAPDGDAYAVREYEAPIGEVETALAQIWCEVLNIDRVGRHDNFFELGGHSLLMVRVIERMRALGLKADVRSLFTAPTLMELSVVAAEPLRNIHVPANLIPEEAERITPEMLTLWE
jgi:aryl carrier-like protein